MLEYPAQPLEDLQNWVGQYARERFTSHVLWSLTLAGSFVLLSVNMRRPDPVSLADLGTIVTCILQFTPLAILGTFTTYFILRTFLYDSMFRVALWLTPRTRLIPDTLKMDPHVLVPPWLEYRLKSESKTYRGVNENLFEEFFFGSPVTEAWIKLPLLSPYTYLRVVLLGAIPWTRLPLCVEQVEWIFSGVTKPRTYIIPGIVGIILALWAYLFLVRAI